MDVGLRVALFSGGKDSVYAALLEWPVDVFVTFVYEFPRPSPHLVNLHKVVELANSMFVPMVVLRVHRGREKEEEAKFLSSIGASRIIAGDQNVEDHLRYMEELAGMVGAELREPIWGMDPWKVLEAELRELSFVVIGAEERARELMCSRVDGATYKEFLASIERLGIDPIGEAGEYHSLVTKVGKLGVSLEVKCEGVEDYGGYRVARLR